MTKQTRRRFSPEYKEQSVARLSEPGATHNSVAAELGVTPTQLKTWRLEHEAAGSAAARAAQKAEAAELMQLRRDNKRLPDAVEGFFLVLGAVEIGKSLQVCAEMGRREVSVETAPPELLGLIGSLECVQRIDPGVLAREPAPAGDHVVIGLDGVRGLQRLFGPSRRKEPAGDPGSDRGALPGLFVNLFDEGVDIALGVGNVPQGGAGDL